MAALELLFPPATARDEDLLPRNKPKCDRKDDPCYIQYLEDTAWCGEVFTDDLEYEKCMGIAELNWERFKKGQPRIEPDPRKYPKPKKSPARKPQ